ncbi:hypothetical protein ACQP2Y_21765 [Actinoplanes sp. CA-051413]|uniref:hypothetical protein n=1 Tax=Actinoplanes sp. CA-051413 TaxID=3239899 RepID=UPI003D99F6E8
MTLPYALGCPSCCHYVTVSAEDPDASSSEMYEHLHDQHAGYRTSKALELLGRVTELTEAQVVAHEHRVGTCAKEPIR